MLVANRRVEIELICAESIKLAVADTLADLRVVPLVEPGSRTPSAAQQRRQ